MRFAIDVAGTFSDLVIEDGGAFSGFKAPSCGVISGFDPRAGGAAFINVVILGAGGGLGARPSRQLTDDRLHGQRGNAFLRQHRAR
jgi:hypothetical protein